MNNLENHYIQKIMNQSLQLNDTQTDMHKLNSNTLNKHFK